MAKGNDFSRRDILRTASAAGMAWALDASFGSFLFADPAAKSASAKAKAPLSKDKVVSGAAAKAKRVIQIFLPGGMAAQETFDPKPFAPIEYRGEIKSIKTKIPGVKFSSLLPRTAKIADKITVVRSMTHGEADHDRGTHNMMTGYRPSPALLFPSFGSVLAFKKGARKNLPPYVCIPNQPNNFAGSGYLSSSTAPFSLGADPARGNFKVRDLDRPKDVNDKRADRRRRLLDVVNKDFIEKNGAQPVEAMNSFYEHAYALINSKEAREAFDLKKEPKKVRDQYGRNQAGQRMLLARRLVEKGVRWVTLTYGGWDMHDRITFRMKRLLPAFDQAYAALIADLEARKMLKDTLVLVTTEFGRTPKINKTAGRDHWPKVFSIAMAGGGVKRGYIHGRTDATATEPEDDGLKVEDWSATVYSLIGINPQEKLTAPGNRPIPIVKDGKICKKLLA